MVAKIFSITLHCVSCALFNIHSNIYFLEDWSNWTHYQVLGQFNVLTPNSMELNVNILHRFWDEHTRPELLHYRYIITETTYLYRSHFNTFILCTARKGRKRRGSVGVTEQTRLTFLGTEPAPLLSKYSDERDCDYFSLVSFHRSC